MRGGQSKKNLTFTNLSNKNVYGNELRDSYAQDILKNAPIYPKPLEYADIDSSVREFVENELGMTIYGKDVPTYNMFSNQRFSEYSQTWEHSDEEGNLILNFKTITRVNNPNGGENQGGLWNIPGERFYTIWRRDVLEDNGTESVEICSMKQPYAVNLEYHISFITDLYENITTFNEIVNDLFKSRQFYVRPNNHYLPLIIDDISDESKYSVSDYRFYTQTITLKCLAYIIHEEDIKVEKFPKRVRLGIKGDEKKKVNIDIDEEFDELSRQTIKLSIGFESWVDKTEFEIDTDFDIESIYKENVRNLRIHVNDEPIFFENGFKVKNGDRMRIKVSQIDIKDKALLVFEGTNPNVTYDENVTELSVYDEPIKHQDIEIE